MIKIVHIREWIVRSALALAIFIPIYMAIAALGSKFGLWDWRFSFGTLVRNYGVNLLKISAIRQYRRAVVVLID
jgi:fatty-acyl-CoA synthase